MTDVLFWPVAVGRLAKRHAAMSVMDGQLEQGDWPPSIAFGPYYYCTSTLRTNTQVQVYVSANTDQGYPGQGIISPLDASSPSSVVHSAQNPTNELAQFGSALICCWSWP